MGGTILVLVWLDGLAVNRIPVRLRHWTEFSLPFYLAYTVWTVLQSPLVFDVDNPDNDGGGDGGDDDDKIYAVLDWASSPAMAVGLVSVILFVFSPVVHGILWGLSLPGRRYCAEGVLPAKHNNNNSSSSSSNSNNSSSSSNNNTAATTAAVRNIGVGSSDDD